MQLHKRCVASFLCILHSLTDCPLDVDTPLLQIPGAKFIRPEDNFGGGSVLLQTLKTGNEGKRTCLLIADVRNDPLGCLVNWLPIMSGFSGTSTIGYAFSYVFDHYFPEWCTHMVLLSLNRADDAVKFGFDTSLYGRHSLDYIIAVPLDQLRKYNKWRLAQQPPVGGLEVLPLDTLHHEAGLVKAHATALHEILTRKAGSVGRQAHNRFIGNAVPQEYLAM